MSQKQRLSKADIIATQMIKGLGKQKPTQDQLRKFREKYQGAIDWIETNVPMYISVGVIGAIAKGFLWFGKNKISPFSDALKKGSFNGHGDPAHILYLWLRGRSKHTARDAYKKTVAALRAYCDGRQLTRMRDGEQRLPSIHSAETDLFDWDDNYTIMIKKHIGKTGFGVEKRIYDPLEQKPLLVSEV